MDGLQRTQSRDSSQSLSKSVVSTGGNASGGGAYSLSSASSGTSISRKARAPDAETTSNHVERAGVSMPPPATRTVSRNFLKERRQSRASDSLLLLSPTGLENGDAPLVIPGQGVTSLDDSSLLPASAPVEGKFIHFVHILLEILLRLYLCDDSAPRILIC